MAEGVSKPAAAGDEVGFGSALTAISGAVDVSIDKDRVVRLLAGTEVRTRQTADATEFHLDRGTLLVNFKAKQDRIRQFRIVTPTGVCGIRGTAFFVKQDPEAMCVGVERGEVYLRGTAGGEVAIPAGRKAVATLTAPVSDIDDLVESERELLTQVNVMNFDVVIGAVKKIVTGADVKAIEAGLEMHRVTNGAYPDRLDEAMEGTQKDPWGNPFNYIPNDARDNYQLSSSGPDGKVNTADDIRLK